MLFMKLHEYHEYLKPFVEYLNFMPREIIYDDVRIHKDNIKSDQIIKDKLEGI